MTHDSAEENETRILQLTTLLEASNLLNAALEITEVLNNILTLMVRVVQAEAGTLWIVDETREVIRVECAIGPSASTILGIELQPGEGIVGRSIESGVGHLIENVAKDAAWARRVDDESGFVTRSMMTLPLVTKGKSIGAIQVLNKKDELYFGPQDFELSSALAIQSALALQNSQMYDEILRMSVSMIRTLAATLDARDKYTAGHSERVSKYALQIARRIGMSAESCNRLEMSALLHDIGKIGVKDEILLKPDRLTRDEFETIKQHTVIGAELLSKIEPARLMKDAIATARWHHERLDGSGYPDQLTDNDIPLFARVVAVADSFDAMTTRRPYHDGRSYREAMDELLRGKAVQYDETLVDALYDVVADTQFQIGGQDRTVVEEPSNESI